MLREKNKLMLKMSAITVLISLLIHLFYRVFHVFGNHSMYSGFENLLTNIFLVIPLVILVITFAYYNKNGEGNIIQWLIMLTLTFSSISMISGGAGMVEYHFSIFMVIAIQAYYDNIKVIIYMAAIFAVQHVVGFFLVPRLFFGSDSYTIDMLFLHAFFLVLTAGATIMQIYNKQKYTDQLKNEKAKKEKMLKNAIVELASTTEDTNLVSQELLTNVEKTKNMSNTILEKSNDVKRGAKTQLDSAEQTKQSMIEMSEGILQLSNNSSIISNDAIKMTEQAQNGVSQIRKTIAQIGLIDASAQSSTELINKLSQQSNKINKITEAITSIAGQTNLLSLNASIEAARAGEAGKGFAVVADEVRQLAEQSTSSASQISELISDIQTTTDIVVKSMDKQTKNVSIGKQLIDETGDVFNNILEHTENLSKLIQDFTALSEEMSAQSEEITRYVDNMQDVAKQTNDRSKLVSDAAHEQLGGVEMNFKLVNILKEMSEKLASLAKKMQI